MARAEASQRSLSVAMLVANDVSVDTRVQKTAAAVAELGYRVTVLGMAEADQRDEIAVGSAEVVLLEVGNELAINAARGRGLRSDDALKREILVSRAAYRNQQRSAAAALGWLGRDHFERRTTRRTRVNSAQARANSRFSQGSSSSEPGRRTSIGVRSLRFLKHFMGRRARRLRIVVSDATHDRVYSIREQRIRRRLRTRHEAHDKRLAELTSRLVDGSEFRRSRWETALPWLHDMEAAYGPALDRLEPDVIHIHDVHLLGVAVRHSGRRYLQAQTPKLVYDAHEYIAGLGTYRQFTVAAFKDLEASHVGRVDHVITISSTVADLLKTDYALADTPTVVMNIPAKGTTAPVRLREAIGLNPGHPLAVYSGGLDPSRGVHTLVSAVGRIEGLHLALVAPSGSQYARQLRNSAMEQQFVDRVHFVDFVESSAVVDFLSSADIGVHPMVSGPANHEVALPNKLFEYLHAGLRVVVSDCRAMSELVNGLGVGWVFESENVDSLERVLRAAIDNVDARGPNAELLEAFELTWDHQRQRIQTLYRNLASEGARG